MATQVGEEAKKKKYFGCSQKLCLRKAKFLTKLFSQEKEKLRKVVEPPPLLVLTGALQNDPFSLPARKSNKMWVRRGMVEQPLGGGNLSGLPGLRNLI